VAAAATASAAEPARPAKTAAEEPAPLDDGLEQIRKMAIRDAERALGIYRPAAPPPRTVTAAPATPGAQPARPPQPAPTPAPTSVAAVSPAAPAAPAASQPAEPPAERPQTKAPARKMSAKAMQHFRPSGAEDDEPAAPPRPAPAPATPAPAAASAPPTIVADDGGDGSPLPLTADASIDELARAAATSPSAAQRIELIGVIRTHKIAAVVAALRANANNAHPGVRAAAEAAMAALFGPNWNTMRAVPKPIQRPPSDDKDRGPPGGW
jgi:hypothetical protein